MIDRPQEQRTPLMSMLHRIVAVPWVYDLVQRASGAQRARKWLTAVVTPLHGAACVLDLGGGTGIYRDLWAPTATYICLDLDPVKLQRFRTRHREARSVIEHRQEPAVFHRYIVVVARKEADDTDMVDTAVQVRH